MQPYNPPVSCLLVNDDTKILYELKKLLEQQCPEVEVLAEVHSVTEAYQKIKILEPELVILDLALKQEATFNLLDQLAWMNFRVIFTTDCAQCLDEAQEHGALHFLKTPLEEPRFGSVVKRVLESRMRLASRIVQARKVDRIALPNRKGQEFIQIDEITHCVASGCYTEFYLKSGVRKTVSKSIGYYEKILDATLFCRTHNKYMVNIREIIHWEKRKTGILHLTCGNLVDVSARYKEVLMSRLRYNICF